MKKFIARKFFNFYHDRFSDNPLARPTFLGIQLICEYWHHKYQTNIIQPFKYYARDNPDCDPRPYCPLYSENLKLVDIRGYIENARQQSGDHRLAFIIGAKHALFMVYIKEGDKEAILFADSINASNQAFYIKKEFGINVFDLAGYDLQRQADNYSCFNDALAMGRDTTAIDPQTGEYRIKNLLAVLEKRVVNEKNGIFYTKLPNQLLKTSQISTFVDFHKEEDQTIKIHKNLTLDEFREKYNKQYLRILGIKLLKKAEIQFYINKMKIELGGLSRAGKNDFINSAKKILKAQPEAELYSLADEFLKSLKSSRNECQQEVIKQPSLTLKREQLEEFERDIHKTIHLFEWAALFGNIKAARALLDDQSLISNLEKTGYLWECANTDPFFAKELLSKYPHSFTEGEIKALKWRIQHHYRSSLWEKWMLENIKESTENSLEDKVAKVQQPKSSSPSDKNVAQLSQLSLFSHMLTKGDANNAVAQINFITIKNNKYRCSIGHAGVIADKKEGDSGTPLGSFQIRKIYYRPDKINPTELKTNIPLIPLTKNSGWCDDVNSAYYNKFIKLPSFWHHEKLWREDDVYDVIGVLSYNDDPVLKGKGSAIFLHIARENNNPTDGCIALTKEDLLNFISQFSKHDHIKINLSGDCEVIHYLVNEKLILDIKKHFPINKNKFLNDLFAFSNDCNYPSLISKLKRREIEISDKEKVGLLVGPSNLPSMLPELRQFGINLILSADIDIRVHNHNLHILNCMKQSDTPENFIENYFINNPIEGCKLPGIPPGLRSPSNYYSKKNLLELLRQGEHVLNMGEYHFLSSLERYLLCKSSAEQIVIERLTLDLMNKESCLNLALVLQRNNAELAFCNFTNIHEYDTNKKLSSSLVALTHTSNQLYVMFSKEKDECLCLSELSESIGDYFKSCFNKDYEKYKKKFLKKESEKTTKFSNVTLAQNNMLIFKSQDKGDLIRQNNICQSDTCKFDSPRFS